MAGSFIQGMRIKRSVSRELAGTWQAALLLMAFFLAGYLLFASVVAAGIRFPLELVTGAVFFGGACYVYLIIRLANTSFSELREEMRERRLAVEELRSSEGRLRSIVESTPMGMHLYRLEAGDRLVLTGANPAADRILGVAHAPLIGKTIGEAFPQLEDTDVPDRYRSIAGSGEMWHSDGVEKPSRARNRKGENLPSRRRAPSPVPGRGADIDRYRSGGFNRGQRYFQPRAGSILHDPGGVMMSGSRRGLQRISSQVPGFLALVTALFLWPGACSEPSPVEIGFVGGLSGRVADLGISGRNGAVLAIEEKNRAGGISGRPVKLIVRDDEQSAETALLVDRELVDRGVEAIIGHMTSSMTMAAVDYINGSDTILISPTTTTTYLTGKDDHFLRVNATTKEYATKMARHLSGVLGLKEVAVIYDLNNKAYTESWFEDFRSEYEPLGGAVTAVETYSSGPNVHFSDVVGRALSGNAEGLVIIASAMDAAMFSQQVRKKGRALPVAAAEWAATETLVEMGGSAVEGIVLSQFFDRDSKLPGYVSFRKTYRERFGEEPGFASVNAYDAAAVVLEALDNRQKGETLKEAILRISNFAGVQGPVVINRYGDADRKTFITTISGGRFRVLE